MWLGQNLYALLSLKTIKSNFKNLSFDYLLVGSRQLLLFASQPQSSHLVSLPNRDYSGCELSLPLCFFKITSRWSHVTPLPEKPILSLTCFTVCGPSKNTKLIVDSHLPCWASSVTCNFNNILVPSTSSSCLHQTANDRPPRLCPFSCTP